MKVAIIPARGGSKRIPRKNIKSFLGKPIVSYSIHAAIESGIFDKVIVSTDDQEIAEVSARFGAQTPFLRPAELADDFGGTQAVVAHAVRWLRDSGLPVSHACCIYATAPFISADDLVRGLNALEETGSDYAIAVTSYSFPIQRAVRMGAGQRLEMFQPEFFNSRSQELEDAYHDAGQFCWGLASAWLAASPVFASPTVPVFLPRHRVQDIDTPEDWERAEWMFKSIDSLGDPNPLRPDQ